MIQTILTFILGFLTAGLVTLIVAPPIWRRGIELTRRRVEASMPMSRDEIQADKDRIRAEYAMQTRRLEMNVQALKEKLAEREVTLGRDRTEVKGLRDQAKQGSTKSRGLEVQLDTLEKELTGREEELEDLHAELEDTKKLLAEKTAELKELERRYEEASFSSSTRQVELVARESDVEKLKSDLAAARARRKELEGAARETGSEIRSARDALKAESGKVGALEKKIEGMLAALTEREETLAQRQAEIERLRKALDEVAGKVATGEAALDKAHREIAKLQKQAVQPKQNGGADSIQLIDNRQAEIDALRAELQAAEVKLAQAGVANGANGAQKLASGDRERLEARLLSLTRENRKLRAAGASGQPAEEQKENAALREQVTSLAAEVVHLATLLEGPDGPVTRALAAEDEAGEEERRGERMISLAERVRALQKEASAPSA